MEGKKGKVDRDRICEHKWTMSRLLGRIAGICREEKTNGNTGGRNKN